MYRRIAHEMGGGDLFDKYTLDSLSNVSLINNKALLLPAS